MNTNDEELVQEMSSRLIRGWAMLSPQCPKGCACPLFEHRRLRVIECPRCLSKFEKTGDSFTALPSDASAESTASSQRADSGAPRTEPTSALSQNGSTSSIDNVTSSSGQNGHVSVADRDKTHESDDEEDVDSSEDDLLRERREVTRRRNEASELMGQYLLRGWAMLDDICPGEQCIMPLLRDPKSPDEMLCVECGCKVVRAASFDARRHRALAPHESAALPSESAEEAASDLSRRSSSKPPRSTQLRSGVRSPQITQAPLASATEATSTTTTSFILVDTLSAQLETNLQRLSIQLQSHTDGNGGSLPSADYKRLCESIKATADSLRAVRLLK